MRCSVFTRRSFTLSPRLDLSRETITDLDNETFRDLDRRTLTHDPDVSGAARAEQAQGCAAAAGLRHARPCVRAGIAISLRRGSQLHAAGRAAYEISGDARHARLRARRAGTRQRAR